MADLLTVYDDDQANSFIDCMICDKRIRGDTHYKIHVTTIQHLKKEEALVAQGQIPRQPELPEWTDIKQYLEYLNLDEPIIGLRSLMQIPDHMTEDGKAVLKYKCRMCFVEMDLYSMVAHIVGRKHRQKYLELRRPDLVTWNDNTQKQPGLVARAKAAVVEKQEGWGTPVALKKRQVSNVFPAPNDPRLSAPRQPYPEEDFQMKPYNNKEQQGRPYYTDDNYEQYDLMPQQSYSEENQHQRSYKEAEVGGRHLRGDNFHKRGKEEMHTRPYPDQGGRTIREDYEEGFGRGQFSRGDRPMSLDIHEKVYHESVPKNRFNDKDLRVHRSGGSEYQEEQMEGRHYGAYGDRNPVENPVHGRGLQDEGRRGTVRDLHKTNEMPGYPHMLHPRDPRGYPEDEVPAKKKKKSRFSDATAEEIALAHMRHSKDSARNEKPRGTPIRGGPVRGGPVQGGPVRGAPVRGAPVRGAPPLSRNQFAGPESASHVNTKSENVLDIFNEIQIDTVDDAAFLKEKLCSVLKEFQAKKSVGHPSQSVADHRGVKQMDMRRDSYNPRDDPDAMYLENRGFQEPRRYEDDRRGFQDSRQYEDDPRAFRDVREGEEEHRNLREARQYGDESKRFDSYPSDRAYADDPRGFQMGRLQDNPQNLQDRRRYDHDLRENEQHFEEYSRAEGPRSAQEPRYYEDDYRGFGNSDSGRNWDHHKGRSVGFEDRGPENVERGFKDPRMFGAGRLRSHPNENGPGEEELYDPFNPSASPPPEASSSTSLDKIASTLLELVARR